ncbi:hypothetical protein QNI14_08945 [Microbacterium sp. LX3-4]|uniref:GNAT family N-acetyltransferase n=1 Tax=Microbacterium dauci TaxID=3048008 RepID=A0ABT6ZEJ2_9MICO|nr:hypothetical protein [Microbacterium sp. LX3-4]
MRAAHAEDRIALWHEVEPGFWVGNTPGRFLGSVEFDHTGYIARDQAGVRVGKYSDAIEARIAVSERHIEPGS